MPTLNKFQITFECHPDTTTKPLRPLALLSQQACVNSPVPVSLTKSITYSLYQWILSWTYNQSTDDRALSAPIMTVQNICRRRPSQCKTERMIVHVQPWDQINLMATISCPSGKKEKKKKLPANNMHDYKSEHIWSKLLTYNS